MGAEVPVPDVARSDWAGGAEVRDDVLPAAGVRDRGDERTGGPRAHVGEGAAEALNGLLVDLQLVLKFHHDQYPVTDDLPIVVRGSCLRIAHSSSSMKSPRLAASIPS